MSERVILAYSGGLDTSVAISWIGKETGREVVAVAIDLGIRANRVGDLQTELIPDFFAGFAAAARANVHLKVLYGRSSHHRVEATFKAFARALRVACARDRQLARMLPSTKGLL